VYGGPVRNTKTREESRGHGEQCCVEYGYCMRAPTEADGAWVIGLAARKELLKLVVVLVLEGYSFGHERV